MTKQEYVDILNTNYEGLHSAVIFHYDPLTEQLEVRAIYTKDRNEAYQWLTENSKLYNQMGVDFKSYLNGVLEWDQGDVFEYVEGWR